MFADFFAMGPKSDTPNTYKKIQKFVINSADGPESSRWVCGPTFTVPTIIHQATDPGTPPPKNFRGREHTHTHTKRMFSSKTQTRDKTNIKTTLKA